MTRSKFAYYDDKNIIPPSTNWFHCHLPSRLLFMRSTAMTWRGRKIATRGVLCLAKQWNPWPVLSQGAFTNYVGKFWGFFRPPSSYPPTFDIFYLLNVDKNLTFLNNLPTSSCQPILRTLPRPTTATSIGLQLYIGVQWVKYAEFLHFAPCKPIFKKILAQTWSNSFKLESICLQNKCFNSKKRMVLQITISTYIDQFSNLI